MTNKETCIFYKCRVRPRLSQKYAPRCAFGVWVGLGIRGRVGLDCILQLPHGSSAEHVIQGFVLEKLERGHGGDALGPGNVLALVHVHLDENDIGMLVGEASKLGSDRPAGATPRCCKVHHDQLITRLGQDCIKVLLGCYFPNHLAAPSLVAWKDREKCLLDTLNTDRRLAIFPFHSQG